MIAFAGRFEPDGRGGYRPGEGSAGAESLSAVGRARLDDAEELRAALGLRDTADCKTDDVSTLATALLRWGPEGLRRVRGEFAVAVCGPDGALVAARDRFGVVPLFHARAPDGAVCIASTAEAALQLAGLSAAPDEATVARFVAGLGATSQATAFRHVRRLPAGAAMRVFDGAARVAPWFTLERPSDADAHTVRHAGEAVREALGRAVAARIRDRHPNDRHVGDRHVGDRQEGRRVGTMLSGGLDSSAVAALAQVALTRPDDTPLPTLSLTFDDPRLDERRYIHATLAAGRYAPTFVRAEDDGPHPSGSRPVSSPVPNTLCCAYGLQTTRRLYAAAAAAGLDVLLDGHGGDEVISHGHGRLIELAREGRLRTLWRESRGLGRTFNEGPFTLFATLATSHGPLARLRLGLGLARRRPAKPTDDALLRAELATHLAGDDKPSTPQHEERDLHLAALRNPMLVDAFEELDAAAASHGVEPRYPFFDAELVRLCLSLPGSAKLADGWTRRPLREAVADLLPPAVAWRADKTDFTRHFLATLAREAALGPRDEERLAGFVDVARLRRLRERVMRAGPAADLAGAMQVWRCMRLSRWMSGLDAISSLGAVSRLDARSIRGGRA